MFFPKKKNSGTLSEYQTVYSVGPDLGPNCLQKVSCRGHKLPLARRELMFYDFLITYLVLCLFDYQVEVNCLKV